MNFNCIIVDDEPLAHTILEEYLAGEQAIQVIGSFYNAMDTRNFLKDHKVDLLFLDINMPEEDGMTFLKTTQLKPLTILTTATVDHALEAYDLDVIDYLVKPIRPERFKKAINKVLEFLRSRQQGFEMTDERMLENRYITIKSGREIIKVDTEAISHIQALKDYMMIYCSKKKYIVRSTITKMLDKLPADQFVRAHKSFIVNKKMIKRIASSKIEIDDFTIPLGKLFRSSFFS